MQRVTLTLLNELGEVILSPFTTIVTEGSNTVVWEMQDHPVGTCLCRIASEFDGTTVVPIVTLN
jgi:hypothetical protein